MFDVNRSSFDERHLVGHRRGLRVCVGLLDPGRVDVDADAAGAVLLCAAVIGMRPSPEPRS